MFCQLTQIVHRTMFAFRLSRSQRLLKEVSNIGGLVLLGVLFLDVPKNGPQYLLVATDPPQRPIQQPIKDSTHLAPLE
jgi:hypothetical protein